VQSLLDQLKQKFGDTVVETSSFHGDETALVRTDRLLEVCSHLKSEARMNFLMDICGVDYPEREQRFEVVYHLYSYPAKKRLRLKVRVTESDPRVPSIVSIWKSADWFEREAFDLFGIIFEGHPHLRRLLTYDEFEGHALRKDYPINRRQKIPTPSTLLD
jgi:NADH-quinone oxidoreductase subunit C